MDCVHPLHRAPADPVRFGVGHGFFVGEGSLRGVTDVIKRLFTPRYNPKFARGEAAHAAQKARAVGARRVRGAGRGGMARGRKVDSQLARVVRLLHHAGLSVDQYLGKAPLPVTRESKDQVDELERLRKKAHPFVGHLLNALVHKLEDPLYPIDAQVAVGCYRRLRLGTGVDLVCRDERGGVWIVEIKTGYTENYRQFCGYMRAPFNERDDSPYHQHQIQLLLTTVLYRHTFPLSKVVGACVVRIDDYMTYRYDLEPYFVARKDACLAVIETDLLHPPAARKKKKTAAAQKRVRAPAAKKPRVKRRIE